MTIKAVAGCCAARTHSEYEATDYDLKSLESYGGFSLFYTTKEELAKRKHPYYNIKSIELEPGSYFCFTQQVS